MEVKLICVGGKHAGQQVPIPGPRFFIGRAETCHLRPGSKLVGLYHAVILVEEKVVVIRDFASKNGTYVNGERIKAERRLTTGARLNIGPLEFEVHLAAHVGGKRKPNVRGVQESAARAAEAGQYSAGDDSEIVDWLRDEQGSVAETQAAEPRPLSAASIAEPGLTQTTTMGGEQSERDPKTTQSKERKPPGITGCFRNLEKPTSEDSTVAAADTLRGFLSRRR